jgi:hypothetical protein
VSDRKVTGRTLDDRGEARLRVRCRNQRCRCKLTVPTENEHKAFCTPYCYNQFYSWKCKVCEEPILKGKRLKPPDHCQKRQCRTDFRLYPETFTYPNRAIPLGDSPTFNSGSRSAHFTGVKYGDNGDRGAPFRQHADGWLALG